MKELSCHNRCNKKKKGPKRTKKARKHFADGESLKKLGGWERLEASVIRKEGGRGV